MRSRIYGELEVSVWKNPGGFIAEVRGPDSVDGRDIREETHLSEGDLIDDLMGAFRMYLQNPEGWWDQVRRSDPKASGAYIWFSEMASRLAPFLPEAVEVWNKEQHRRAQHRHLAARPHAGPKEWIPGVEQFKREWAAITKNLEKRLKQLPRPRD